LTGPSAQLILSRSDSIESLDEAHSPYPERSGFPILNSGRTSIFPNWGAPLHGQFEQARISTVARANAGRTVPQAVMHRRVGRIVRLTIPTLFDAPQYHAG